MRIYPLVVAIARAFAIIVFFSSIFGLFQMWAHVGQMPSDPDPAIASIAQHARMNVPITQCLISMAGGVVLYFLAPFVGWLVSRGLDRQ